MKFALSPAWPSVALYAISIFSAFSTAELPAFAPASTKDYDEGLYGFMPTQNLSSTHRFNTTHYLRRAWDPERCDRPGQYYFLDPHGFGVGHNGPEIISQEGRTVWFGEGFNNSYGFRPQLYNGEMHLTWWSGRELQGHGEGYYYIMDKNYRIVKNFTAVGETPGDVHEFEITSDNTAIISMYDRLAFNLTSVGVKDGEGYIYDSVIQEIDLDTGKLVFEWRASDHVSLKEMSHPRYWNKGFFHEPWDCYHLNSVEKDRYGNYLVSIRHTSTIYYLAGGTGEILWRLGGHQSNFKDLTPNKDGTNFYGQHHARWHDDMTTMTVYDNNGWFMNPKGSRAMKLDVDLENMTVKMAIEVVHPRHLYSATRGSIQILDDGMILVGYGSAPAFSEFSPDGKELVCDWQFGALHAGKDHAWSDNGVASYRVFRMPWKGYPLQLPDVVFDSAYNQMYVSWNGATEVQEWVLEGMEKTSEPSRFAISKEWKPVAASWKNGFETNMSVAVNKYSGFRLAALDASGGLLGVWTYNAQGEGQVVSMSLQEKAVASWRPATALLIFAIVVLIAFRMCRSSSSRYMLLRSPTLPRWARPISFTGGKDTYDNAAYDNEDISLSDNFEKR